MIVGGKKFLKKKFPNLRNSSESGFNSSVTDQQLSILISID